MSVNSICCLYKCAKHTAVFHTGFKFVGETSQITSGYMHMYSPYNKVQKSGGGGGTQAGGISPFHYSNTACTHTGKVAHLLGPP